MLDPAAQARWQDAMLAVALFAIDPPALGGIVLRARHGPARETWLRALPAALPAAMPWRRMPAHIREDRLLGGLDLGATLAAGRPVAQLGLLGEVDGGVLVLPMAERLPPPTQAALCAVLDHGMLRLEREGLARQTPSRFGVVALDESRDDEDGDEPRVGAALQDRLALQLVLDDPRAGAHDASLFAPQRLDRARARLPQVQVPPALLETLCATAMRLGIVSLRASSQAVQVARLSAALDGRDRANADDAKCAVRLVLAARATMLPEPEPQLEPPADDGDPPDRTTEPPREPEPPRAGDTSPDPEAVDPADLENLLLAAAAAALPAQLLERLRGAARPSGPASTPGRAGASAAAAQRGRPAGVRRGRPGRGARVALLATLRAAAPWQPLRRAERTASIPSTPRAIDVRREDFHVARYQERQRTTTIFVVDASGSSALHRLAEAKGAVERLLAECYVRRDEVAVIAFRGTTADLVLPPTRSLLRAKRGLAGLPGGGGTPLAAALDAGLALAAAIRRRGCTATLVVLTDGRANVCREGHGDRRLAQEQARAAARGVAAAGLRALLIDTSPRAQPEAGELAALMRATYLPLPQADSRVLSSMLAPRLASARRGD